MSTQPLREAATATRTDADFKRNITTPGLDVDDFLGRVADWLDGTADHHDHWHGVRQACRELHEADEEDSEGRSCECSTKDCYEHGMWHDCTHGAPDTALAQAVANTVLRRQ